MLHGTDKITGHPNIDYVHHLKLRESGFLGWNGVDLA